MKHSTMLIKGFAIALAFELIISLAETRKSMVLGPLRPPKVFTILLLCKW